MADKRPKTPQTIEEILELAGYEVAREVAQPLTGILSTARDLYERGLNVFPIPRPDEVRARAAIDRGIDPRKKPSYRHKPLFNNRLHNCTQDCKHPPINYLYTFDALFQRANLAVMLGRTSGNLAAVDCDSAKAFEDMGRLFERQGLYPWAYRSKRGGAYLLRVIEGEILNQNEDTSHFPNVEIWGRRRYVVLPPSVHPSGIVYQWETGRPGEPLRNLPPGESPPAVHIYDLEWLGVELAKKERRTWQAPELVDGKAWTATLSRKNRRILNDAIGLTEGIRNQNLTKPVYDVAAHIQADGVDYHDALSLLERAAFRCGYDKDHIGQMLRSALSKHNLTKSVEYYGDGRQDPQPRPWQLASQFAGRHHWQGRTAQTDRAVFLACCERARRDDSDTFRASTRELAELAAKNKETVANALARLRGDPQHAGSDTPVLLEYVTRDGASSAAVYRFSGEAIAPPSIVRTVNTLVVCGVRNTEGQKPTTENERDLFGRQLVAWRVWRHLCLYPEPSKAAIARNAGLAWSSVSRALNWLEGLGLTGRGGDGNYYGEPATDEYLGEVAKSLGLHGRMAAMSASHNLEREIRANRAIAGARQYWQERTDKGNPKP